MSKWSEEIFQARLAAFQQRKDVAAAQALADNGDERALPALVACALDQMEGPERVAYQEAVLTLGQPAVLGRWLKGGVTERRVAAHALTARLETHVPLLRLALWDADDQVRAIARRKLVSFVRSAPLHDLFVDALGHADARVRTLAAEGLVKIGKGADVPVLRAALGREQDVAARVALDQALAALNG